MAITTTYLPPLSVGWTPLEDYLCSEILLVGDPIVNLGISRYIKGLGCLGSNIPYYVSGCYPASLASQLNSGASTEIAFFTGMQQCPTSMSIACIASSTSLPQNSVTSLELGTLLAPSEYVYGCCSSGYVCDANGYLCASVLSASSGTTHLLPYTRAVNTTDQCAAGTATIGIGLPDTAITISGLRINVLVTTPPNGINTQIAATSTPTVASSTSTSQATTTSSFTGTQATSSAPSSNPSPARRLGLGIGIGIGLPVLFAFIAIALLLLKKRSKPKAIPMVSIHPASSRSGSEGTAIKQWRAAVEPWAVTPQRFPPPSSLTTDTQGSPLPSVQ